MTIELPKGVHVRPFPIIPEYLVSDDGRVLNKNGTAWLRPAVNTNGYLGVCLSDSGQVRTWLVHRIVALTFLGTPPTPRHEVAHDDGDKHNNAASNLAWRTRAENEADKIRHGRTNRGERNANAKLTTAEVIAIRQSAGAMKQVDLAQRFSVDASVISKIVNGKAWSNVVPFPQG